MDMEQLATTRASLLLILVHLGLLDGSTLQPEQLFW
jgi:hypothetical protein